MLVGLIGVRYVNIINKIVRYVKHASFVQKNVVLQRLIIFNLTLKNLLSIFDGGASADNRMTRPLQIRHYNHLKRVAKYRRSHGRKKHQLFIKEI